jgi:hypothetical protein
MQQRVGGLTPTMWDIFCYIADSDHPVYARVRPYARSAKALQRRGFVTIGRDDITRLTDAGRAFLVRYRRRAVQGKRVAEGLTLHLDDISSLFGGRGAA